MAATAHDAINVATLAIDQELARDAGNKGIELSEGLRALNQYPLRVLFLVREEGRIAEGLRVKLF
jgi:hypothetical protein